MYDKKRFLSKLACGLCSKARKGRELPTIYMAAGLRGVAAEPEREPVAYLYNGKNMGELPEWDVSKFPYACIERSKVSKTSYKLYLMKSKVYGVVQSDGDVNLYGNISYLSYSGGIGQHWHSFHDNTSASGSFLVATDPAYAVWANHDIIADDGSMILPASDPVPVYE
mgnify:CR=1 FL=1